MRNGAVLRFVLGVACATGMLLGQGAKQLTVKSKGEAEAVMALQTALQSQSPDGIITASDNLLNKYADTDFKVIALYYSAEAYGMKNDFDKMIVYAERTLQADPKHYQAMLLLAGAIAQRTREHDLDKEEKLKSVEKYVQQADEAVKTAVKPNPNLTDEQWEGLKKGFEAQGLEALGLASLARAQNDKAIEQFKKAVEIDPTPNPSTMLRLAVAYTKAGKPDESIAVLDKVLATPNLHPQIKQIAQAEKARATQAKSGGAAPANNAPPQIEVKKP
ncbi:MAG TPA: tetratricopeptide repeat protein [Bryobacteraceae bacterium]|nr:tetratricopeptide repeat protein [Bryobacteraceae bacterium]